MPPLGSDAGGDSGPGPPDLDLADRFADDRRSQPADERVYRVALQLYEPTRVAEVAARADCSPDTARRHLARLADIGVVERTSNDPDTFARNSSYFEWRKRNRLEQLSRAELEDRLLALTDRESAFRERYDADAPGEVDAFEHADYPDIEDVWTELSEWETVRERIRRLENVRRRRQSEAGAA